MAAAIGLKYYMAKIETDGSPKVGARRFDPTTFLATAAKGRAISTNRKGTTFFAQGDATDAIFYIKKGKVKITVVSKQGKEAVVALLSADEFFGEGCLEMQRALSRQPSFSRMFLSHVLTRSARVEEDLVDQLFNSTEKRLARLLLR